jgi:hypothetical protein
MPQHFKVGLGACENFERAAEILAGTLTAVSAA